MPPGTSPNTPIGAQDLRVEHWRVAEQQGRVAALNMLGKDVSYDAVPMFWTIQYFKQLDYIGHAKRWDEVYSTVTCKSPRFWRTTSRAGVSPRRPGSIGAKIPLR